MNSHTKMQPKNKSLCDQNCGVQTEQTRQTDGQTNRKVKTEGPRINV